MPKRLTEENEDLTSYHIMVVIEWDGDRSGYNGTWYDFLHSLDIRVHGDRGEFKSPLKRRERAGNGNAQAIALGEGTYLCANESIALQIGAKARKQGASLVTMWNAFGKDFSIPEEDVEVLENLMQMKSKRGRKAAIEAGTYVVTCFDEAVTRQIDAESQPFVCTGCGSHRIDVRSGHQREFVMPKNIGDPFEFWCKSRFGYEGTFELPKMVNGATAKPLPELVNTDWQLPPVLFDMSEWDLKTVLHAYDILYILDNRMSNETRMNGRRMACDAYYDAHYDDEDVHSWISVKPRGGYDLIDLCIVAPRVFGNML